MQTKFKRHQKVRLLTSPDPEYMEPYQEDVLVRKGDIGEINIILPNGKYHIRISDKEGNELAYIIMSEEELEAI